MSFKMHYMMFALKKCIGHLGILKKSREDSHLTTDGKKPTAEARHTPEVRLLHIYLCEEVSILLHLFSVIQAYILLL